MKNKTTLTTLFLIIPAVVFSQLSQVTKNPTQVTEQFAGCLACPGTSWINPMYAVSNDSMYATTAINPPPTCNQFTCYYARALMATDFKFNLPAAAIVKGIKADVLRKASANSSIRDTIVQLLKGTNTAGTNHATNNQWQLTAMYETYGDSTDLWGTTWTPTDINSSQFGVFFKPMNKNPNLVTAMVDHVQLTVYYLDATGINETLSSDNPLIYADDKFIYVKLSSIESDLLISVFNNAGEKVFEKNAHAKNRNVEEKFSTEKLSSGIYFVKISDGKNQFAEKSIILH